MRQLSPRWFETNAKTAYGPKRQPGGLRAQSPADIRRDGDIGVLQFDVERDQKLARPHRGCAGSGVQFAVAEIGKSFGIGPNQVAQGLESTAADVFQIDAIRPPRRRLVEINR